MTTIDPYLADVARKRDALLGALGLALDVYNLTPDTEFPSPATTAAKAEIERARNAYHEACVAYCAIHLARIAPRSLDYVPDRGCEI